MIYQLYNLIVSLFFIVYTPALLLRGLLQKSFRQELAHRFGCFPNLLLQKLIWVHAASVGEVFCAVPLIQRIKREVPQCGIVITTMTRTGNETARKQIPEADGVFFFPLDHPLILRRALQTIRPSLLLIAETELWPNLLRSCGRKGIPIALFNGRISDKSFPRYHRLKFFFENYLKYISLFLMQTEKDRLRIVEMGAPPTRTKVTGNIKYDQIPLSSSEGVAPPMAKALGLRDGETIFIAGSTRPGEEEILLTIFRDLRKTIPHLIFLLAPRHLNRLEEVERILQKEQIRWIRRTSLPIQPSPLPQRSAEMPEVILLDTLGELTRLYSLGTLVFIGGSLVPLGGQNPLEPLLFKKCVLFGPHMSNFAEIARLLTEAKGAIQVRDKEDLASQMQRLLQDEAARKEVGEKGYDLLQKHRGATDRIFEEIRPFLSQTGNGNRTPPHPSLI